MGRDTFVRKPRVLVVSTIARFHTDFLVGLGESMTEWGLELDGMANGLRDVAGLGFYVARHDASWTRNPLAVVSAMRGFWEVRRVVRQNDYDVVHVHTPIAAWLTRAACATLWRNGPMVVYTAHGFHFHEGQRRLLRLAYSFLEMAASRWTSHIAVLNRWDLEEAERLGITKHVPVSMVSGAGLNLGDWDPCHVPAEAKELVRRELGVTSSQTVVAMVAEMIPRKRHIDALEALGRGGDWHLLLVGDGPLRENLDAFARQLDVRERVHFAGYRSDVRGLLAASDLMVLPSMREGLPMAVIESLALGVPVVGTDSKGLGELVERSGGYIVPPKHPDSIAQAILHFVNLSADERRRRSEEARNAAANYSLDIVAEEYKAIYASLVR